MSLSTLFFTLLIATCVKAQDASSTSSSLTPLASRKVDPSNIPYQVVGANAGPRGPQAGYNLCNSTTEGSNSLCQTMWMSDATDFCIWSSPKTDDTIGESEAYEVAWCTKPGHGTRLIPEGTFTGLQWLYAKNYIQVVGYVNQANLNLDPTDLGGELDPHGDDEQGNPLGGIVFSGGFSDSAASFASRVKSKQNNTSSWTQVIEWVQFIGNDMFCAKFCNPSDPNAALLCNHIYDEIGCAYNAVADYSNINGTYQVCDSDDMTPPGVYTTDGTTTTWFQPFTGNPSAPYTPNPISSSNCQTFASTDLFLAATTSAAAATATGAAATGTGKGVTSARSGSGTAATASSTGGTSSESNTNGASTVHMAASLLVVSTALFGAIITITAFA